MPRQSQMLKLPASTGCLALPDALANYGRRESRHRVGSYLKNLHYFVAEMIDDLDRDAP